jgi:hypothetical protein
MFKRKMSTFPQNTYHPQQNYGAVANQVNPQLQMQQIEQNITQVNQQFVNAAQRLELARQQAMHYGLYYKFSQQHGYLVPMTIEEVNAANAKMQQSQQQQTQQPTLNDKLIDMVDRHSHKLNAIEPLLQKIAAELGIKETPQAQDKPS